MIDPWLSIGIVWLGSALAMAALWAFSMRVRNIGYVDVGWAGLMAIAALFIGVVGEGSPMSRGLVAMFGSVWGARLCLHLLHRVLNEEEDGRYRALREAWGGSPAKFFGFFQMQAVVVALFALPFIAAAANPAGSTPIAPMDRETILNRWSVGPTIRPISTLQRPLARSGMGIAALARPIPVNPQGAQ